MGRLVDSQAITLQARTASANNADDRIKEHLERVAKYVPAEIIAVFVSINTAIDTLPFTEKKYIYAVNLLLWWIITFFYFKWVAKPDELPAVPTQQKVSVIAFIIWAYAFTGNGGVFGNGAHGFNIYYPGIALIVLALFTFVSGFIVPKK